MGRVDHTHYAMLLLLKRHLLQKIGRKSVIQMRIPLKKGSTWHFGYKYNIGVDKDTRIVHTVEATAASIHDDTQTTNRR